MFVFDSNVLVEFLRGRLPQGLELLNNTDTRLVKIPAIVQAELLVGAYKSARSERNAAAVESLICNFEVLPFDSLCARAYARIRSDLEKNGMKIGPNDLIIAATALAHGATLVTNNVDEFKRVPGLRILSVYEVDFPG